MKIYVKIWYPKVLSEDETLDIALNGRSISRYGDGELRLALGGTSASQEANPELKRELQRILAVPSKALPCIPNYAIPSPKKANWEKYAIPKFTNLYKLKEYGSSLITRPDTAPWIDRDDYWEKVRGFWKGRDVVLVNGGDRSLRVNMLHDANSVREVKGLYRDAYREVGRLQNEIEDVVGKDRHIPILLCLGACATVLAVRLADKGFWAVDLGHVGMMIRRKERGISWRPDGKQIYANGDLVP